MSGAFSLWDEMKAYAARHSRNVRPLRLNFIDRRWLRGRIVQQFLLEDVPSDAYAFYEEELSAMLQLDRPMEHQSVNRVPTKQAPEPKARHDSLPDGPSAVS